MKFRKLGRTGLDVSIIGLGGEYLEYSPANTVISVIHEALDNDINYFDLFMASPDARDNYGNAFKGKRDKAIIAGHLGSAFKDGQYYVTRDKEICEFFLEDLLKRLNTDYIDILMLHFVDEPDDVEHVFQQEGLLNTALRLKQQGKTRYIGMSSHKAPAAIRAVESGLIDVLMYPANPAWDGIPGKTAWPNGIEKHLTGPDAQRVDLFQTCARMEVGLVAMKPYAGGRFLRKDDPDFPRLTPVQCLHYSLTRPGVCTVVPGCKNNQELKDALMYLDASNPETDFSFLKLNLLRNHRGRCVYCNHCLPCPSNIDIAEVARIVDISRSGNSSLLQNKYDKLSANGSNCIECGDCIDRCPFEVNIIGIMHQAQKNFGKVSLLKKIAFWLADQW